MQIFNRLTERALADIRDRLDSEPEMYEDQAYLDKVNADLKKHYAYLIVRKGSSIIYCGDKEDEASEALCRQLLNLILCRMSWREAFIWTERASI